MLYVMRHGKTDWNKNFKLQGKTDIPLNEEGREMARTAAERYRDLHIDLCYSSPLVRAKETAEIFLEGKNVEIITDDRLTEMSFGIYEGIENSFNIPDCPVNVLFKKPEEYVAVEEGESLDELFARTGEFIEQVVLPQLKEGKDILLVGHGAMNCSILSRFKGLDVAHFWDCMTQNCELVAVEDNLWK